MNFLHTADADLTALRKALRQCGWKGDGIHVGVGTDHYCITLDHEEREAEFSQQATPQFCGSSFGEAAKHALRLMAAQKN